jgi:hypothetical protein
MNTLLVGGGGKVPSPPAGASGEPHRLLPGPEVGSGLALPAHPCLRASLLIPPRLSRRLHHTPEPRAIHVSRGVLT